MTARLRKRSRVPAALAAALLLACGDGLYDADGVPLGAGGGAVCEDDNVPCGLDGACVNETVSACGLACTDCAATVTPPQGGVVACVGEAGAGTCGYACTDGRLRCDGGCCGTAALAAGAAFTCALLDDGSVRCWGANERGQLAATAVASRPGPAAVALPSSAVAIGAGTAHACVVLAGGAVRCWGANEAGQATGAPSSGAVVDPAATPVTSGAIAVAAGERHTCAIVTGGAVRCWGDAARTGGGTPVASGASAIAAGRAHTCAVVAGGAVTCWGDNANGQLGTATAGATTSTPIASGVAHVSASADQTCVATGSSNGENLDDALRCWGDSVGAAYGLGEPQRTPAIPQRDPGRATVEHAVPMLAAGAGHVCVVAEGGEQPGTLECLGANDEGQLGVAFVEAGRAEHVAALPAVAVVAIAAGEAHTCAALADGRLRCWGSNASGQLGDGTTSSPDPGVLATPLGE